MKSLVAAILLLLITTGSPVSADVGVLPMPDRQHQVKSRKGTARKNNDSQRQQVRHQEVSRPVQCSPQIFEKVIIVKEPCVQQPTICQLATDKAKQLWQKANIHVKEQGPVILKKSDEKFKSLKRHGGLLIESMRRKSEGILKTVTTGSQ